MNLAGCTCDMCSWMGGQKPTYYWALLVATAATDEAQLFQGEWEKHSPLQTSSSKK